MSAVQEGSLPPDREVAALANCKGSVGVGVQSSQILIAVAT